MPIIAIVIGAIGTAVGTAVGAAIGGTILGVSMATIGGVIGAGIAGGALAAATGGSFGKGFLMGAAGAAVGGFLKGGLGDAVGSTASAGAGEAATSLAEGAGEGLNAAGYMAPEMGTSAVGDLSATAGGSGMGELGGVAGEAAGGMSTTGDLFSGMGETGPTMTPTPTPAGSFSLESLGGTSQPTVDSGFSLGNMMAPQGTTGFEGVGGGDAYSTFPGTAQDVSSSLTSGATPSDYSYTPSSSPTQGSLENIGQGYVQPPDNTTSADIFSSQGGKDFAPTNTPQQPSGGLGGMFKTSDAWLKNTFGQSAPSTGKLLLSGGSALYDKYQTDKLARQSKGLAPMSFEQYQQRFTNPDDYTTAANTMAQAGRTGTLPILLARMKERARAGYAGYLPGAQQQYLGTQADIASARSRSLGNLFRNAVA